MPLKVTWKKGMRLSTDVFNALDSANDAATRLASLIASGGRFGMFPTIKPFELSVNINNNILDVVSLCCHGITKSGKLVDIEYDSNYTSTFDTRVAIPASGNTEAFLLVVKMHDKELREVSEMYSEDVYTFELIGENSIVDNDSLPIGHIVNQYGWRLNETDFVPPCLYVNAHYKYVELFEKAKALFKAISDKCISADNCAARHLLSSIWPCAASEYITLDKERETITPGQLFASVQRVVNSFVTGCSIDEYVSLENVELFSSYLQTPFDTRNMYHNIEKGLELCAEISTKMESACNIKDIREVQPEKPKSKIAPIQETTSMPGRNRWEGIEI